MLVYPLIKRPFVLDLARGAVAFIPFQDLNIDPITLKLAVRARGTLDAFPSVLVEELRAALPSLRRISNDDE